MFVVKIPESQHSDAIKWVIKTVLSSRLGQQFEVVTALVDDFHIELGGRTIVIANNFFERVKLRKLMELTGELILPSLPLKEWFIEGDTFRGFSSIPVLYGEPGWCFENPNCIRINLDIFGATFFMLSRIEEMIVPDRDMHDRFPGTSSLAFNAGILERPIVDEYVEILWVFLKMLWPQVERKADEFKVVPSHDVDVPSAYAFRSIGFTAKVLSSDLIKRRDPKLALQRSCVWLNSRRELHRADPYNTFDWLMSQSEAKGLRSAFYFICGRTSPRYDAAYELSFLPIRDLLQKIDRRGHEIGLHPSYDTYKNAERVLSEANNLRKTLLELSIKQKEIGGRMHYLRWENPTTWRAWDSAGLAYDSTLGFADRPGFRCGTCHDYNAFDIESMKELRLIVRPLIVMESSVLSKSYLGIDSMEAAVECFSKLKTACRLVSGNFTILWHNSELHTKNYREIYQTVLQVN